MSRKFVLIIAGVVAAIALLLGVQFRSGNRATDGALSTLTIGAISMPVKGQPEYLGTAAVVQEQGWLKEQLASRGVKLEWFPVSTAVGGPLINESFASKRIAFALYGDFPSIIANAGGIETQIVVPYGAGGTPSYLIVRNGLNAKSIKDLKGLKVALHRGRPWELTFSKLAEANGLKLSDFQIYNLNPYASAAALASGEVDAFFALSDALLLQKKKLGRIIWSTKEAPPQWTMRGELFGRRDFIESQPELTQLVATAFVKAAYWASLPENRDRYVELSTRTGLPRDVVEEDLRNQGGTVKEQVAPLLTETTREHYREVADYAFKTSLVRKKVDADALFAPRFVDQALKDLSLQDYWPAPSAAKAGQ